MRLANLMRQAHGSSWCFCRLRSSSGAIKNHQENARLTQRNIITIEDHREGCFQYTILAPHAEIDAYGLLHILGNVDCREDVHPARVGAETGRVLGYRYRYFWLQEKQAANLLGMTQRLINAWRDRVPGFNACSLGIAVSCEDRASIEYEKLSGNGFLVAPFSPRSYAAISDLGGAAWRQAIRNRASRTRRLLLETGQIGAKPETVWVSSIGRLGDFPWAPRLMPQQFMAAATPTEPSNVNIMFWAAEGYQSISICGSDTHPAIVHADKIREIWSEVLSGSEGKVSAC